MIKVLIAEDDCLIAEMLEDAVAAGGYQVCGVAADPAAVAALGAAHQPDLAIIDLRLGGGNGIDAALRLSEIRRSQSGESPGILFATGNCGDLVSRPPPVGEGCLRKPFIMAEMVQSLKIVEEIVRFGRSSLAIPAKLHLFARQPG